MRPHLAPRGAPNSPPGALRAKQMASRSHQDASGDVLRPTSLKFGWQNATADGGENVGKLLAHHTGSWALWRCRRAALLDSSSSRSSFFLVNLYREGEWSTFVAIDLLLVYAFLALEETLQLQYYTSWDPRCRKLFPVQQENTPYHR